MLKSRTLRTFRRAFVGSFVLVVAYLSGPASAQEERSTDVINILWTERPPFQFTGDGGKAEGLLVEIGRKIFEKAGIPYTESMLPANRVIRELTQNTRPACAVGWYKSEERLEIAQFSKPVYHDKPLRGVFRADAKVALGTTANEVLRAPKTRVLIKQGFAYGPYLDDILNKLDVLLVQRVSSNPPNLLQMIKADRADLVLLAQEEIDFYSKTDPKFYSDFKVVVFKDLPETDQRFIMCSKSVTGQTLGKIDAAIEVLDKAKCKRSPVPATRNRCGVS